MQCGVAALNLFSSIVSVLPGFHVLTLVFGSRNAMQYLIPSVRLASPAITHTRPFGWDLAA